jgi:hypothetical protein
MFFNLWVAGSGGCKRAEKQSYEQGGGEKAHKGNHRIEIS